MADQNPRLAIWNRTDQVVRQYELSGGLFVLTGSKGVPHGGDINSPVWLGYTGTGDYLLSVSKASLAAAAFLTQSFDLALNPIGNVNRPTINANNGADFVVESVPRRSTIRVFDQAVGVGYNVVVFDSTGAVKTSGAETLTPARHVVFAATGSYQARIANNAVYIDRISSWPGDLPQFNATDTLNDFTSAPTLLAVTPDGLYTLVAQANGKIAVLAVASNGSGTTRAGEMDGSDPVSAMAFSPDGRFLAVGRNNASTGYRTTIYRRKGPFYTEEATFAGMGKLLGWTGDSSYLIDASGKKAVVRDDEDAFTSADSIMANVVANPVSQAVSPHSSRPTADARLYDVALPELLIGGDINISALKITLLKSAAFFDPNATDTTQQLAQEVNTGGWPAGGKLLANPAFVRSGTTVSLRADDMSHSTVGSGAAFQHIFIYDSAANMPVIMVSMSAEIVIPEGVTLTIDLDNPGIVQFVA